jgi:hypothetical protein
MLMLENGRFLTGRGLKWFLYQRGDTLVARQLHQQGQMNLLSTAVQDVTFFQALTLAIAFLGAVLGVINTWHGLDKSRVKLRVRPAHAIPYGAADPRIEMSIEITNLSSFAITVREVGLFYKHTKARGAFPNPILFDGGSWPRRLEPRSSVMICARRPAGSPGPIKCAYARTECGVTQTGNSPALRQISREESL